MKILRIRFQNLNSLPSGDIDLERAPFSEAGLFAITGPTGAGKSTLLDALTLALYGRAARYDNAPNPENMMSRHAGLCQAEVVFEIRGVRYRAEWQLRRARGKADGKLQPAARRLYDAQEQVLAQNITEADRLIEELTGLNYDRFLRSALLAQGQFAQFFKATESQRAELLESLTGTVIYSELGALAFREAASREQALEQRAAAIGEVVLLNEEQRAEKTAAIERLDGELAVLAREREKLAERLEQGRRLTSLGMEEAALAQKQNALAQEREKATPELERLARHRQGEPFFTALQTLDDLLGRARREAAEHGSAQAGATRARIRLASGLAAARALAEETLQAAARVLETAGREQDERSRQVETIAAFLADRPQDGQLDAALPGLVERLAGLASSRVSLRSRLAELEKLEAERQAAAGRLESLKGELAKAREAEETSVGVTRDAALALADLLNGKTPDALFAEARRWEQQQADLMDLRVAMEKRDRAAQEGLTLSDTETALEQELETARAQKLATEGEAHTQAHLLELAGKNLSLLERIAGFEDQRAQLTSGSPCPLCGALEHPLASGAPVSREIEEARRHVATAKAANATAIKEAELAAAHLARTEEALRNLNRRRGELRREQMSGHDAFERLARALRVYTAESLEEAMAATIKARAERDALLGNLREMERRKAESELLQSKAAAQTARIGETLAAEQNAIVALDHRGGEARVAAENLRQEIEAHGGPLAEALEVFNLPLPGPGEEPGIRDQLEQRHRDYQKAARERLRLEGEQAQAAVRIEALEHRQAALTKQVSQLTRDLPELAGVLPERELTDGFLREWKDLDAAAAALGTLRSSFTAQNAAVGERLKTLREVEDAAGRQAGEIRKALAGSPFVSPDALREARLNAGDTACLAKLKARFDEGAQALAVQRTQLQAQARSLREADAPQGEALAAVEAEWKAREEATIRAAESRSTLRNELQEDSRNAERRDAKARELEEDRKRFAPWAGLRELIGSADGKKFSRFAQGLSLDVLLRHANRHLRRLSDRYELRRATATGSELGLEIVDLHQAGSVRPTSSLSGGESFLASLAMALGLSDLAGRNVRIDSLFIDEGFGSLDADTLDLALAALDTLRLNHKTVGVISHVELLKERIPVQIRVEKQAGGLSRLRMPWDRE